MRIETLDFEAALEIYLKSPEMTKPLSDFARALTLPREGAPNSRSVSDNFVNELDQETIEYYSDLNELNWFEDFLISPY